MVAVPVSSNSVAVRSNSAVVAQACLSSAVVAAVRSNSVPVPVPVPVAEGLELVLVLVPVGVRALPLVRAQAPEHLRLARMRQPGRPVRARTLR
jgi:hypothetical protein